MVNPKGVGRRPTTGEPGKRSQMDSSSPIVLPASSSAGQRRPSRFARAPLRKSNSVIPPRHFRTASSGATFGKLKTGAAPGFGRCNVDAYVDPNYRQTLAFNLSANHDQDSMPLPAPPQSNEPGSQDRQRLLRSM